jgi:branched-chain amino acid transport system permease protein
MSLRGVVIAAWPAFVSLAIVSSGAIIGLLGSPSVERSVMTYLINITLVLSLAIFTGTTGVFSFGHMAFAGIGAYTGALLLVSEDTKAALMPDLPDFIARAHASTAVAVVMAGLIAGAVSCFIAIAFLRLTGLRATLATFGVLVVFHEVAANWSALTRGTSGMIGVPALGGVLEPWLLAAAAVVVAFAFQASRHGVRNRAAREDEQAARALGIAVAQERAVALVLSAVVAGMGGAMYAKFLGSFNPDAFYLSLTFLTIAMLVVGGIKSVVGAVVGVTAMSLLSEVLRNIESGVDAGIIAIPARSGIREVGFALALLIMLAVRPRGLMGVGEIRAPKALTRFLPSGEALGGSGNKNRDVIS